MPVDLPAVRRMMGVWAASLAIKLAALLLLAVFVLRLTGGG